MPKVHVDFSLPPAAGSQPSATETRSTASSMPHPLVVGWQEAMAKKLGGRTSVDRLGEQALERMDRISARAHALRNLAARFPNPGELDNGDRLTLAQMRMDHVRAMVEEVGRLRQDLLPVSGALTHRRAVADYGAVSWPQGAERVLRLVRDVEAKLAILFGGAAGNVTADLPDEMFDSMAELAEIATSLAQ